MSRKGIFLFLTLIFSQFIFVPNLSAQEEGKTEEIKEDSGKVVRQSVTGKITEIAVDGTYLSIGDKKIITTKEFLDDSFVSVGDNVEITVGNTPQGIRAIDYKYIYEEENDSSALDENMDSLDKSKLDTTGE